MIGRRGGGLALAVLLLPAAASAGALGRPNIFAPLGPGIGGAGFAGVKNPSTIHYNPAGLILSTETTAVVSVELVAAPREFRPPSGPVERSTTGLLPVPAAGLTTRLARRGGLAPLPIAIGIAFYNSFGGRLSFDENEVPPGVYRSSLVLLEVVPALAWEVSSKLSVGVGVRLGIGLFDLANNERRGLERAPSQVSGSGLGAGATLGVTLQPIERLRLGVVYSSPLSMEIKGSGAVELQSGQWRPDLVAVSAPWPQWAALGVAVQARPSLLLLAGLRWTDWSAFQELVVDFSVISDAVDRLDLSDSVSAHLGAEWQVRDWLTLRGGLSYESNTLPERSLSRTHFDAHKVTLAAGGSLRVWRTFHLDLGYEAQLSAAREVADGASGALPGSYSGAIHAIGLGARYLY